MSVTPITTGGGFQLPSFDQFDQWISNPQNAKQLDEILADEKKTNQYFGQQ